MFSFGHLQLLKNPTRIFHYAAHTSVSLIDHIWTNILKDFYSCGIIKAFLSDHFPIFMFLDVNTKKSQPPKYISGRNFSEENLAAFKTSLETANFGEYLNQNETQRAYDSFHTTFFHLYDGSLSNQKC